MREICTSGSEGGVAQIKGVIPTSIKAAAPRRLPGRLVDSHYYGTAGVTMR